MRRFYHISLGLVSCISACLATEFINPPAEDDRRDSSVNAVYAKGATINIQWTAVDAILAVTLFQLNKTDPRQFLLGLEYIATSLAPNTTSFTWTVQTRKSLEEPPIFYMYLFVQGETSGRANSHAFNISLPGGVQPQSSSIRESLTSSLVTVDATSTPSSAPMATTTPVLAPLSTASPTSTNTPITATEGGLSGIGKIGVGIGVSAAVVLGVTVGWLFFGRKGRADKADITSTVAPQIYYESKYDSVSQPVMPYQRAHELPPNTTAESRKFPYSAGETIDDVDDRYDDDSDVDVDDNGNEAHSYRIQMVDPTPNDTHNQRHIKESPDAGLGDGDIVDLEWR